MQKIVLGVLAVVFSLSLLMLLTINQMMAPYASSSPAFIWSNYLNPYMASNDASRQLFPTNQQSIAEAQLTRSINQHQRNITTLRLCEPAAHYAPNFTSTEEHWPKIAIPQQNSMHTLKAVNESTSYWKFYEVQVSIDQGEIRIPLLRGYLSNKFWLVDWFTGEDVSWLKWMESNNSVHCMISYADNTSKVSRLHVSAVGHMNQGGQDDKLWATCATDYYKIPTSLTLSIIDNSFATTRFFHDQSVRLPICQFTTPVYYVVAQLRALFSFDVHEVIDWIAYHYVLGVDHFFFHYRYHLTAEQEQRFAPLVAGGVLTLQRWPIQHEKLNDLSVNTDQNPLLMLFSLRIAHHATWVLAVDHDEYIRLNTTLYPRECSNSLWCRSPLKDWLEERKAYSLIVFDSINIVADLPPTDKRLPEDAFRYANNTSNVRLPLGVRRVWRRGQDKHGLVRHTKWFYHVQTVLGLAVHGGSGIRPMLKDYHREFVYIYHYHDYPIWEERGVTNDPSVHKERVDAFWASEGVRDTYVSDVYEQLPWPTDASPEMIRQVRPYMGKHTPNYEAMSE